MNFKHLEQGCDLMNNEMIRNVALRQSSLDFACDLGDLCHGGQRVTVSTYQSKAKNYLKDKTYFAMTSYGSGVVAKVEASIQDKMSEILDKHINFRCFEFSQLTQVNEVLKDHGKVINYTSQYFLPDVTRPRKINKYISFKLYDESNIRELFDDKRFEMALCYKDTGVIRDVIAVAGYIDGHLAGLAGASNDSETMWQVGIDVLPEFRRNNVASTLVSKITDLILEKGIVPFYGTAWSNLASIRTAHNSGYVAGWVEVSASDLE